MNLDNARRKKFQKVVEWRLSSHEYRKAQRIISQLEEAVQNSDTHMALLDDLRSLGYPREATENDFVQTVITDKTPRQLASGE